ncbi:tyrosine-type recombinase/integrase [Microvirga lotononidis]|uniref:Site-specific recombinase XerD n=1 Tax=Microvirga lotononidis TaxID=864069 RepID=I4YMP5_9HYPH|nr:tyrosine-type recombinase/integrase [Microvirga lotononidis]EIM25237.1 site-specific recombinase XerD [Microvirga lotononidis]WQO29281.1 tyrosine-type recombinase/integrase [Microvirga lotononidis]
MARSTATDKRFLELKSGKWRVTVAVPRDLHGELGTRLKKPLHTDSLAVANVLKWQVVGELKAVIEQTRKKNGGGRDPLIREALEIAAIRSRAETGEEYARLNDLNLEIESRAEIIAGKDPDAARQYAEIAHGQATPIDLHHETFVTQSKTKARTQADDRRAIAYLKQWCEQNRVRPMIQAITRKAAVRFMDDLHKVAGGHSPITLNKYLGRLSRYWQWLVLREHAELDPWARLKIQAPPRPHDEEERAFTDAEVKDLLEGPATQRMQDLMRIGALTGARLDAIVDLKVGDCEGGIFVFKPQKKETKPRAVPVHPDLEEIIKRRTEGKEAGDDLFPEWPAPRKVGSQRERSFKASNAFTDYRRSVGVDHIVPGKRRSLVNFHSFRRWFITKAEQADQPESIIAAVVGHKRKGMTLGRYSAGPLMEQARRCVEAVSLPTNFQ